MKKRIFSVLLLVVFILGQTNWVEAKRYGSFRSSRSFSFKSKSSSGFLGSSKRASSKSRSIPGSFSSGKSTKSSVKKTASARSSYMKDTYKATASKNNYTAYKKGLNDQQKKTYESSMNQEYTMNSRMNFDDALRTRSSRISSFNRRPIFMNVNPMYFGGPFSYGHAFVGAWDMWFLMRASEMFWFHHWAEISPYRNYFDQQKYTQLESRVKELEGQGVVRDPQYMEPGVDPDLQLSSDYQEKHLNSMYYTNKGPNQVGNVVVVILILGAATGVLILIIRRSARPKSKKSSYSRIY